MPGSKSEYSYVPSSTPAATSWRRSTAAPSGANCTGMAAPGAASILGGVEMLKQAQMHVKAKAIIKKQIRLNTDVEKGTAQKLELSEEFFERENAEEKSSSKSFVDEDEEGEQKNIDISINTNDAKLIMCQKHYI